jgi:hypothetical protein
MAIAYITVACGLTAYGEMIFTTFDHYDTANTKVSEPY